jgi:transposase
VACFNPALCEERGRKREALLEATERALEKVAAQAAKRTRKPLSDEQIGFKVGKALGRYKMGKHIRWEAKGGRLIWRRDEESVRREKDLDGIYIVRTSEPAEHLSASDTVRAYKGLSSVERAFRCMKGIDLKVRPIFLSTSPHVRAHFFLCMLAYYVEWHMRRDLAPLLFEDEDLPSSRLSRDPVAPARSSESAKAKKATRRTQDGLEVHSFETLLAALATQCRNTCRMNVEGSPAFYRITDATPLQLRAYQLLGL